MSLIGVIGGSGLYAMAGLQNVERMSLDTPYGPPSDEYVLGSSGGQRLAFLPRHGVGHRLLPSELNFRANIHGFKQLGADAIVSLSAVGSLREDIAPGHVVVPDQLVDRTRGRVSTFFGDGVVAHVSFADPFCPELSRVLVACARESGAMVHEGGTYICMEGPQFSTRAESRLYRSWGGDVIGMTNLQEAKLAREAEICFATLAMATDYDCWRTQSDVVDIDTVLQVLAANSELARQTVRLLAERAPVVRGCRCRRALDGAIITERARIPARRYADLAVIAGRVLARGEPS